MRRTYILFSKNIHETRAMLPLVIRAITAALMISHGLRLDSRLIIHLKKENLNISFNVEKMRRVSPDEQSMKGVLSKALRTEVTKPKSVHPGIIVSKGKLEELLRNKQHIIFSDSRGTDVRQLGDVQSVTAIIPLTCFDEDVKQLLVRRNAMPVKISKKLSTPDALITILNNELDRRWLIAKKS